MKKRTLALAALTTMMTIGMGLTAFAAEEQKWIVPKDTPTWKLVQDWNGTSSWWVAEAQAQVLAWAEANKGDIPQIKDEKQRYEAIVKKVCDFLSYDLDYKNLHIAFGIRDGKAVCGGYTALTEAMCKVCGIAYKTSSGAIYGEPHDALRVTLNGKEYFSDPTNYDTGAAPMYVSGTPSYYREDGVSDSKDFSVGYTGQELSDEELQDKKAGRVKVNTLKGVVYLSVEEDNIRRTYIENGEYDKAWEIINSHLNK